LKSCQQRSDILNNRGMLMVFAGHQIFIQGAPKTVMNESKSGTVSGRELLQ
jgi:hypothetical protein